MKLKIIDKEFCICKIENITEIDFSDEYVFVSKTDEELSVVCSKECVPENVIVADNEWRAFRIVGVLDFSLTGILSKIATILADNKIGIFAVSTYNTDYVLIKDENFLRAINVLSKSGYEIIK